MADQGGDMQYSSRHTAESTKQKKTREIGQRKGIRDVREGMGLILWHAGTKRLAPTALNTKILKVYYLAILKYL